MIAESLERWLAENTRRTAVITHATFDGRLQWYVCLHDYARWDLPDKDWPLDTGKNGGPKQIQKIAYADTLDQAIREAMKQ